MSLIGAILATYVGKEIEVFSQRGAARRIIMDYVRLGASGLQVSRLCLGCMSYGQVTLRPIQMH
jgi:hypothetical protein